MRYPLIVILTIAVAIGIITTFVIPRFAPLFRVLGERHSSADPHHHRHVRDRPQGWYWVIAVAVALFLAARSYVRTADGRLRWHAFLLRLPVIGPLAARPSWRA